MKRTAWAHSLMVFLIGLAITACSGFATPQAETTQPAVDTGQTVTDTAVSDNQPNNEGTITISPSQTAADEQPPLPEAAVETLYAQEQAFIAIYQEVNPSVVHIGVSGGEGSGFVYDQQGYIVTNNHVVAGGGEIAVAFADGRVAQAQLIGTDPDSDLAVIRVDVPAETLVPVVMADSDQLQVGQIVIAIGNPFGLSGTMTTGIISSLDRELEGGQYIIPDVIQTDAAINPGNSGGPLLDLQGRVIGVNSAIRSAVNSSSGVGFAVPANIVQATVPQIITGGSVSHPWLGISGGDITQSVAAQLGLDSTVHGVLVSDVVTGGPAAAAGLRSSNNFAGTGDIILMIDDHSVQGIEDLVGYLIQHTVVGQTVNLQLLRDGSTVTIPLTLGARPSSG